MIDYILQVILLQTIFLLIYDFFLAKETFFNTNRAYLLCAPIFSFIIPFVKIKSLNTINTREITQQLPELFTYTDTTIETTEIIQSFNYTYIIYYAGVLIFTLLFLFKLFRIFQIIVNNQILSKENIKLIMIPNKKVAFSFFNYIFIGTNIAEEKREKIIEHEVIHSKEKHSIDLLFFEILKIIFWFNPIIYLYKKRSTVLHEYITDKNILKNNNKQDYLNLILSETFQVDNISFTNQFYLKSLIKKRIAMMTKKKSKQWKQLKYLSILPVLFLAILYSSCTEEKTTESKITSNEKLLEIDLIHPVRVAYINGTEVKKYTGKNLEEVLNKKIRPNINKKTKLSIKRHQITKDKDTMHVIIIAENNKKFVYEEGKPVPFQELSKGPYFPNSTCERGTKECFSSDISTHIDDNFDVSTTKNLGLTPGKMRVFVMFTITENGSLTNIKCRAPHPNITEEATRTIKSIPKLNPGIYKDKKVITRYSLPISFTI